MKNILRVIVAILIVIITFLLTYKFIPYSQKDADRVLDIDLGIKKANWLDYYRLDMDNSGEIDLYDGVLILKKIKKEEPKYSDNDLYDIQDIYLGRKEATISDYYRLDVNNDKVIDIFDGAIIVKMLGE